MLPEVEVVLPLLRRRQHAIYDAHVHHAASVNAWLRVRRDRHLDDAGTAVAAAPLHKIVSLDPLERVRFRRILYKLQHACAESDARAVRRRPQLGKIGHAGGDRLAAPCDDIECAGGRAEREHRRKG